MPSHFQHVGYQVLSALILFLGLSILAHCLSRRIQSYQLTTRLRDVSWPRLCVVLIFLDSWLFEFASGIVIFGIGLETTSTACTAAISICISFYGTSKILVYAFLVEKVHLVWSPSTNASHRLRSPVYLICMATMLGYAAAIVLMIIGAVYYVRKDGMCVIGLKPFASIPLLAFDLYITIFLNGLFLWPLFRSKISNPKIKAVAVRTLVASLAALITSTINIGLLTLQNGNQLGWVCLGFCGTDVVLNALAIFWVTSGADNNTTAGQTPSVETQNAGNISRFSKRASMISPAVVSRPGSTYATLMAPPTTPTTPTMTVTGGGLRKLLLNPNSSRQTELKKSGAGRGRPCGQNHTLQVLVTTSKDTDSAYTNSEKTLDESAECPGGPGKIEESKEFI